MSPYIYKYKPVNSKKETSQKGLEILEDLKNIWKDFFTWIGQGSHDLVFSLERINIEIISVEFHIVTVENNVYTSNLSSNLDYLQNYLSFILDKNKRRPTKMKVNKYY